MQKIYLTRYKTADKLLTAFNPSQQVLFARHKEKCLMGQCPTLVDIRRIWGSKCAETWIEIQLRDLAEYSGAREKPNVLQLEEAARVISEEFYYLKLSELMLFFVRYKTGHYGKFYGSVDLMAVTEALQKFKLWRFQEICRIEEQRATEERSKQPLNDPESLTYAEWQELGWLFNMGYERDPNTGRIKWKRFVSIGRATEKHKTRYASGLAYLTTWVWQVKPKPPSKTKICPYSTKLSNEVSL